MLTVVITSSVHVKFHYSCILLIELELQDLKQQTIKKFKIRVKEESRDVKF